MPAVSKKQQRFMGMVHAYQKGELKDAPKSVKKAAGSMTKKASKDFAKTKHKGLPEKISEGDFDTRMTLDQLEQELDDLTKEHEEAVLTGDSEEVLDQIEQDIYTLEELIAWKKGHKSTVNVAETFKALSFKQYLEEVDTAVAALELRQMVSALAQKIATEMKAKQTQQAQPAQAQPAQAQPAQAQPVQAQVLAQAQRKRKRSRPLQPSSVHQKGAAAFQKARQMGEGVLGDTVRGLRQQAAAEFERHALSLGQQNLLGRLATGALAAGMQGRLAAIGKKKQAQQAQPAQAQPAQAQPVQAQPVQAQPVQAQGPYSNETMQLVQTITTSAKQLPNAANLLNTAIVAGSRGNKQIEAALRQLLLPQNQQIA
jgi:hypothetical protein